MEWVRLYHDMPTDPKWRVIAKRSGQRLGDVIALYVLLLTNASGNTVKRGETHGLVTEDIAAAIDLDESSVTAILDAMEGKVVKDGVLMGWEKRNPFNGASSTERVRKHRETRCNTTKRDETTREEKSRTEVTSSLRSDDKPRKSKRGIPDGFPADLDLRWAHQYWAEKNRRDLSAEIEDQVERFKDYHSQKLTASADWPASWRTWARNAIKYSEKGRKDGRRPTAHETFALAADSLTRDDAA